MIDLAPHINDQALIKRFWAKVARGEPDECWPWLGAVKPKGYGRFYIGKHRIAAHRFAYALMVYPPTAEQHVDHDCRILDCCNGGHLEAVPPEVNHERKLEAHRRMRQCQ